MSVRWLRSRFTGGALILGYHRITEPAWDPYELCVAPRRFAQQLEILRNQANPIALPALVRALAEGNLPPRAVAVTFDDGYADVLTHAKPLLERYRIPATVFVTTDYLGREFWWDELARLLSPPTPVPTELSLVVGKTLIEWPQGRTGCGDPRTALLLALCDRLRPLSEADRLQAMTQIRACLTPSPDNVSTAPRTMTADEVLELCADGLVEIGSHTATHPVLAALPSAEQRREIHRSKAYLEELIQRPVASFSYPNGSTSAQTSAMVREAGFSCACTSEWDVAGAGTDRFRLPRFWPPDAERVQFHRWLNRWLPDPVFSGPARA
jgi:peptidoglycan/xylan/chitin deacetylase (PgdA/CDA1 family)